MNCCICGKEIYGFGNNPYPVKVKGRCCDECNWEFVIPARMLNSKRKYKGEEYCDNSSN